MNNSFYKEARLIVQTLKPSGNRVYTLADGLRVRAAMRVYLKRSNEGHGKVFKTARIGDEIKIWRKL